MEPAAKKPKFEILTESLEFLDLNDHCIMHVLEKLNKTDLCSTSFTCVRLQELAYAVHMRKFPNKIITIRADWKSNQVRISCDADEKYLKYMSKAVSNVEISCSPKMGIRDYFKVLKKECSPNLKSLRIHGARENLSSIPGTMIEEQLKNLEKISIDTFRVKGISKSQKNWLACCQKLRELSIKTQFCKGEWMLDIYPELESLSIHLSTPDLGNEYFAKNAEQFVQGNPKLKEIKCVGLNTTLLLLRNVTNIPRLIVVCKMSDEFVKPGYSLLADELKIHREKGCIESLELDLVLFLDESSILSEVDAVHPVKGLRIKFWSLDSQSAIENLKHLVHLKIWVSLRATAEIDWIRLSKTFPHLATLKLSFRESYEKFPMLNITMPFVQNMPQLKRLEVIAGDAAVIENDHLLKLNSARLLVKNPLHLHVHFELLNNKCELIIPTSNIITTKVLHIDDDGSRGDPSSWEYYYY